MAKRQVREDTAIQYVAALVPALAAFPSAYFVGRSVWTHLVVDWGAMGVLLILGVVVSVVAGLVVEGLGTVSIFLWMTFRRWNQWRATKIEDGKRVLKKGYDLAPTGLAAANIGIYVLATAFILLVLEAWPEQVAGFAPFLFPFLTLVGGLCWTLYDQHRDRLAFHGLSWNWVVIPAKDETVQDAAQDDRDETGPVQEPAGTPVELDSIDRAILRTYRTQPAASYSEVAETVSRSKSAVGNRVQSKLVPAGLMEKVDDQWAVHWSDNGGTP